MITSGISGCLKKILTFPNIQSTKTDKDVPDIFWEPYITTGYREPNKSWGFYACSLFQLHNETFNVWTHLLGCVLILYQIYIYEKNFDYVNDVNSWPFLGFGILAFMCLGLSAFCHLFNSKSERDHYVCYLFDYVGSSLYGHAGALMAWFYAGNIEYYHFSGLSYMIINSILSILACTCSCMSKLKYTRPYPPSRRLWIVVPELIHVAYGYTPLLLRAYTCFNDTSCPANSMNHHWYHILSLGIALFFFSSDVPERFKSGHFDIVGHAHQWFHVFVIISMYLQMNSIFVDYTTRSHEVLDHMQPDFLSVFGLIFITIFMDIVIIKYLLTVFTDNINKKKCAKKTD